MNHTMQLSIAINGTICRVRKDFRENRYRERQIRSVRLKRRSSLSTGSQNTHRETPDLRD